MAKDGTMKLLIHKLAHWLKLNNEHIEHGWVVCDWCGGKRGAA